VSSRQQRRGRRPIEVYSWGSSSSSVLFSYARINVVLSASTFRDTVTSVIDVVVAVKEMSSGVAGMRDMARR